MPSVKRKSRIRGKKSKSASKISPSITDFLNYQNEIILNKMDEDNQSVDSPAQSNPGTPLPSNPGTPRNDRNDDIALVSSTSCYPPPQTSASSSSRQQPKPKYSQLLAIIEELGKDIRPTYAGSRSSAERLKRGIVHARILVRECLMETERNARS